MPSLSSIRGSAFRRSRGLTHALTRRISRGFTHRPVCYVGALLAALTVASPAVAQSAAGAALIKSAAALDLAGKYDSARKDLTKAIDLETDDSAKTRARRTLAVSYAFTCDVKGVTGVEHQVIDAAIAAHDFNTAADVDNELARILLECGDGTQALEIYRAGHDAALRLPSLPDSARDLWNFRWEHAQARVAARRGERAEANQHVVAAKAILDKGKIPDQARFYPYLTGYVALYTGDPKTAIAELGRADQKDPFILSLIAQAYERSGDKAHAMMYYRNVLTVDSHNQPNAFARPLAQKKLAAG
jgi:tetratricopeptide (TPR) repeat protein